MACKIPTSTIKMLGKGCCKNNCFLFNVIKKQIHGSISFVLLYVFVFLKLM